MVKGQLTKALENVDAVYDELVVIANEILQPYTWEIDALIKQAADNVNNMPNDNIRSLMLNLALKSYTFSEIKEKSSLKAECAEILRKEKQAKKFNETDGTVAFKENTSILESSEEILAEAIHELLASLTKTKLDEVHRVVDVLKNILTTRLTEEKLTRDINE